MSKVYEIGYKKPCWREYSHDFLMETFSTKDDAIRKKIELQSCGYIQVIIKMRKGGRAISDY